MKGRVIAAVPIQPSASDGYLPAASRALRAERENHRRGSPAKACDSRGIGSRDPTGARTTDKTSSGSSSSPTPYVDKIALNIPAIKTENMVLHRPHVSLHLGYGKRWNFLLLMYYKDLDLFRKSAIKREDLTTAVFAWIRPPAPAGAGHLLLPAPVWYHWCLRAQRRAARSGVSLNHGKSL
jgi:hypothetical protein